MSTTDLPTHGQHDWKAPKLGVVTLRAAMNTAHELVERPAPPPLLPPLIAKDVGATDEGGKGYGKEKIGGKGDIGVKDWP